MKIKRRNFLKSISSSIPAFIMSPILSCNDKVKKNIILISSDSMDGRVMGCMGHPAAFTPNMDRLAKEGTLFRNTYCNSPQCVPSRSSMWSGKQTHVIEGWNNFKGLEPGYPTFQTLLEDAGYVANVFGKTDYLSGKHSLNARVTAWTRSANILLKQKDGPVVTISDKGYKTHSNWKTIEQSIQWLNDNQNSSQPFFLYCGTNIPHPQFKSSKYWLDKIDPQKVTLPPYERELHPVMEYMSKTKNTFRSFSEQDILSIRRTYFAMIAELDAMIGEIMEAVDNLGLKDSTYIIYLSDHGEMNMEHRQYLKNSLYEASTRVPLIVSGPEIKSGQIIDDLVSLIDIYPTLMDMAEIEPPTDIEGHSLVPLLKEKKSKRPDWVISQYHSNMSNTGSFMLRQGNWKYIAYAGYQPQLYNLKDDPEELNNLAQKNLEMVDKMDKKLRSIVDYPAVDAKVKAYDKKSFKEWRDSMPKKEFEKAMKNIYNYSNWTDRESKQIAEWLTQS